MRGSICECPLLAQSGHELVHRTCPLSGVKRTSPSALLSDLSHRARRKPDRRYCFFPFCPAGADPQRCARPVTDEGPRPQLPCPRRRPAKAAQGSPLHRIVGTNVGPKLHPLGIKQFHSVKCSFGGGSVRPKSNILTYNQSIINPFCLYPQIYPRIDAGFRRSGANASDELTSIV